MLIRNSLRATLLPLASATVLAALAVPGLAATPPPTPPAWSHDGVATPQALALERELRNAASHGLNPDDYLGAWDKAQAAAPASQPVRVDERFDAQLTAAATRYLDDLHFGRVAPQAAGFDLPEKRAPLDVAALLGQIAAGRDPAQVAASVEPQFIHYRLLRKTLEHYRQLAAGLVPPTPQEAVQAPFALRVRQIELTLERWRWLPAFEAPPIIVNIPQFRLFAFHTLEDRRDDILQMDVIVGKTALSHRTPVFMQNMQYVVFRPYWEVPPSIVRGEMVPSILRKGPGYLTKERLQIVDGRGTVVPYSAGALDGLRSGALRVRQLPGPDNSLGLIKFMLPNHYNVYLHSTPAHSLFSQKVRTFSHGCIRVKDPVALAQFVLRNAQGEWTEQSIRAAMDSGPDNSIVRLKKPIPVLVLYATVLAQEDGQVLFMKDIYGQDARLAQLLHLPPLPKK